MPDHSGNETREEAAARRGSSVDGYKTMEQLLKETFGEAQFRSMVGRGELHVPLKLSNDLPPTLVDSVMTTGENRITHVDKYLNDRTPYMDEPRITITEPVNTTPPDIQAVANGLCALGIDRDHAYVIAYAMDSASSSADFRTRCGSFGVNVLHNAALALKGERP